MEFALRFPLGPILRWSGAGLELEQDALLGWGLRFDPHPDGGAGREHPVWVPGRSPPEPGLVGPPCRPFRRQARVSAGALYWGRGGGNR